MCSSSRLGFRRQCLSSGFRENSWAGMDAVGLVLLVSICVCAVSGGPIGEWRQSGRFSVCVGHPGFLMASKNIWISCYYRNYLREWIFDTVLVNYTINKLKCFKYFKILTLQAWETNNERTTIYSFLWHTEKVRIILKYTFENNVSDVLPVWGVQGILFMVFQGQRVKLFNFSTLFWKS